MIGSELDGVWILANSILNIIDTQSLSEFEIEGRLVCVTQPSPFDLDCREDRYKNGLARRLQE